MENRKNDRMDFFDVIERFGREESIRRKFLKKIVKLEKLVNSISLPNGYYFLIGTRICVLCKKELSIFWGGHLHIRNIKILAGYCEKCHSFPPTESLYNMKCKGCYGNWEMEYGLVINIAPRGKKEEEK